MSQLSTILRDGENGALSFKCPGCGYAHTVHIGVGDGPRWSYNGNAEKPTFSPSVLCRTVRGIGLTDDDWAEYDRIYSGPNGLEAVLNHPKFRWVCHSFVVDGRIQFLSDCTHELAGQTVDLPAWK